MKLVFGDTEIDGFKCFTEPTTLRLSELGPGLHFVRGRNEAEPRLGPNGAGKSSLWDAICWCLYGRTPDGGRNPDIKPWHGSSHTTVRQSLKIGTKNRVVERTANPNSLTLDGKPIGQEQVDALVGLPFDAFTHTVLMGQGQPLFFDLEPRRKMELFSDVLQLERWDKRAKAAGDRATELQQAKDMNEGQVIGMEASLVDLERLLDSTKKQSFTWEEAHLGKLRTAATELETVKKSLGVLEERFDELSTKEDWTSAQIKLVKEDLDRLRDVTGPAQTLRVMRDGLAKQLDSKDPQVCPACGQAINPKDSGKLRSQIRADLVRIDAELKKARKAEKQAGNLQDALVMYRTDAESLRAEINTMAPQVYSLKAQQSQLRKLLEEGEDETNPYRIQLADIRKRVGKLKAEIEETQAEIAKLGRRIERAKFWTKGFKEVKLYVIGEVLQELELATNAALEDLGLVGWSIKFDVEKETKKGTIQRGLDVLITSPAMQQRVRWESWSGGEGQRLRVVGALALSEVLLQHAGVQCSLEILDEPAHFMAPDGVRDLVDYLAWRAEEMGKTCCYVDHLAIESARFASVITVVKTKEGASIE